MKLDCVDSHMTEFCEPKHGLSHVPAVRNWQHRARSARRIEQDYHHHHHHHRRRRRHHLRVPPWAKMTASRAASRACGCVWPTGGWSWPHTTTSA
eukprot:559496-Pleurochrysis_carterae.AAC.4